MTTDTTLEQRPGENIAQTVERITEAGTPIRELDGAMAAVAMPDHYQLVDLERYGPFPRRAKAQVDLTTILGFADYVNRHKLDNRTAVYVTNTLAEAVIDDLAPGEETGSWKDHRARLPLNRTPQWSAWQDASGRAMKQRDFIHFIQDRAGEIVEPDLAVLLHQLSEIKATSSGKRHDRADHLAEGHGRELSTVLTNELPEHLDLLMPILSCEPDRSTACRARLVVKLDESGVLFTVTMVNPDIVIDQRIRELVSILKVHLDPGNKPEGETTVPVFF